MLYFEHWTVKKNTKTINLTLFYYYFFQACKKDDVVLLTQVTHTLNPSLRALEDQSGSIHKRGTSHECGPVDDWEMLRRLA